MSRYVTAGQFQALTGLSAKALRLYAERGIVTPASVDPVSGYRQYSRTQIQHGATVDLLRRAQVPLAGLTSAADFSFDEWRQEVQFRRTMEDFYLSVAERVAAYTADDFTAHSAAVSPLEWVGVILALDIPEDDDGKVTAFSRLALEAPAVEAAFDKALGDLGVVPGEVSWTAVPTTPHKANNQQMLVARSGPQLSDSAAQDFVEGRVRSATGVDVEVVTGRLPSRTEVTFTTRSHEPVTPVEEAASGYLQVLAFEDHLLRHRLTAIGARNVVTGGRVFAQQGQAHPVNVFDVEHKAGQDAPDTPESTQIPSP